MAIDRIGPFWKAIQSILDNYDADNLSTMTEHHAIILACTFQKYDPDDLTAQEFFCYEHACEMVGKAKTCGYCGCKNEADYIVQQTVGKGQELPMCEEHAPEWVKENKPSAFYKILWRRP